MEIPPPRSRPLYLLLIIGVIALGLASRQFPFFPAALGKYPGDALWALMVFLGWGLLFPRARVWQLAALAFGTACAIEASQLYQAGWINALRGTFLGHCILGSSFHWADIPAYLAGVLLGFLGEITLRRSPE